jgi:hypothetical protein
MSYQIKLLSWPDIGNHVIVISRGAIDTTGLRELFARVGEVTRPLIDCKVLIDLEDAIYDLEQTEMDDIFDEIRPELWPPNLKIAIVACPTTTERDQLLALSTRLAKLGFTVSVFYGTKAAIDWLAESTPVVH